MEKARDRRRTCCMLWIGLAERVSEGPYDSPVEGRKEVIDDRLNDIFVKERPLRKGCDSRLDMAETDLGTSWGSPTANRKSSSSSSSNHRKLSPGGF